MELQNAKKHQKTMGFNPLKRKIIQNHLKILIQWVETYWNYSIVKRYQKTMGFNPLKRKIIQNHLKNTDTMG